MRSVLCILLLTAPVCAQTKKGSASEGVSLTASKLKAGAVGRFSGPNAEGREEAFRFQVRETPSESELVLARDEGNGVVYLVHVKGVKSKDFASRKTTTLPGLFEVKARTRRRGVICFVVESRQEKATAKDAILFFPDKAMEVGQVGKFWSSERDGPYFLRVVKIISKDEMLMSPLGGRVVGGMTPFIIRNRSTAGLVDGKDVRLSEEFKVVETKKYGGTVCYVLEPEPTK